MGVRARVLLTVIVGSIFLGGVSASEKTAVEPALPPDAKVTEILNGLGDNSSAVLPPIKTVGEWNAITKQFDMEHTGPVGRDYTNKAVWMPDRNRAFYCGANHGAPHRLDDAWEYDLASNTWVLLFAPDANNATGVMEIKEETIPGTTEKVKFVQTNRGGPTHYGHTWWAFCYDPGMKAALWMNVGIGDRFANYIEQTTHSKEGIYEGPPMWSFKPYEKQWKLVLSPKPFPQVPYAAQMEYVSDLGGPVCVSGGWSGKGTWLYNHATNSWKQLKALSNEPIYESLMAYDSENKVLVAQEPEKSTLQFDIHENKWQKVLDPGKDSADAPEGMDARSTMYYDSGNGVCLLFHQDTPDVMWSYSAKDKKWTKNKVSGPPCPPGRTISYFDSARNVFVVNKASTTWVYRFKKETKAATETASNKKAGDKPANP